VLIALICASPSLEKNDPTPVCRWLSLVQEDLVRVILDGEGQGEEINV